jgi:6-phosphogluconate dehydrogenase
VVVYDVSADAVTGLAGEGATGVASLQELAAALTAPRAICIMVPAAFVDDTITDLAEVLETGDTIIDGGNSYYHDDLRRSGELESRGLHYVDMGTSGGVFGLERGYCLMIGGQDEVVEHLEPFFDSLAPGVESAERTPGREGDPTPAEQGWLHCGSAGAGHFVKMVHNGIEYGMMAAFAEGLNVLAKANVGAGEQEHDAETTPLREPGLYRYDLPIADITEVWRRGSVVASWLLDLTAQALAGDPQLEQFSGRVSDSGEGRWTVIAGIDEGVPTPVLATALYSRFASRGEDDFANRVLSAMRFGFGGHLEKPE